MNLIEINNQIKELLNGLDYATLPTFANISGLINQPTIIFIIGSGKYSEDNYIDLELRISIACEKRTEETTVSDDEIGQNLDSLICQIINKFHGRPLIGTKPIEFNSFEISPPQSGKWRALLVFSIPGRIEPDYNPELQPTDSTVRLIDRRYVNAL